MKYLIAIFLTYVLSSCASPNGCRGPKLAEKAGYKHGAEASKPRPKDWSGGNWHSLCYDMNIAPNPVGYTKGYYRGLKDHCTGNTDSTQKVNYVTMQENACKSADANFCTSKKYLSTLANLIASEDSKNQSKWNRHSNLTASGYFNYANLGHTAKTDDSLITYCEAFHGIDPQKDSRFAGLVNEAKKSLVSDYKKNVCTTKSAYKLGTLNEDYKKELCTSTSFKKSYARGLKKYKANQRAEKKKKCGTEFFYKMGKNGSELSINGCDAFYSKSKLISFYRQGREDYLREKEVKAVEALQD